VKRVILVIVALAAFLLLSFFVSHMSGRRSSSRTATPKRTAVPS